eukprot:7806252-Pyramimonas_sp.AAC.1
MESRAWGTPWTSAVPSHPQFLVHDGPAWVAAHARGVPTDSGGPGSNGVWSFLGEFGRLAGGFCGQQVEVQHMA